MGGVACFDAIVGFKDVLDPKNADGFVADVLGGAGFFCGGAVVPSGLTDVCVDPLDAGIGIAFFPLDFARSLRPASMSRLLSSKFWS